jgi:hypothetical protein
MHRTHLRLLLVAAGIVSGAVAQGQNLVTLEGSFPSAGEFTMHGPNPCGFPNPGAFVWPLQDLGATCGTINPFNPPPAGWDGDAAFDSRNDVFYATDGLTIVGYQQGLAVSTLVLPLGALLSGPLTGLGFDSENQVMWLTDGLAAVGIAPPALGCAAIPAVVHPAFAIPSPALFALDITWDSWSDSLWITDITGNVTNLTTGGAIGPGGQFAGTVVCGLNPILTGIAFDTAQGTLLVTDGATIAHLTTTGAPAAPTFYAPNAPCTTPPPPGPPTLLAGLGFSPRPLRFGEGCATVGNVPTIGWNGGLSTTPNPAFGITLSGAEPSAAAILLIGVDATCTGPNFGACPILAFPFALSVFTTTSVAGDATVNAAIPSLPLSSPLIGANIKSQWLIQPTVGKQTTAGLSFSISTH